MKRRKTRKMLRLVSKGENMFVMQIVREFTWMYPWPLNFAETFFIFSSGSKTTPKLFPSRIYGEKSSTSLSNG